MPDFDRIELSMPEDAIFSVILQYKQKGNLMMVRLYDTFSESSIAPITQTKIETSNSILEEQFIFKGSKGKDYYLFIYYKGERQFDSSTGQEQCEYYNAFIAIETLQKVKLELRCLD